MKRINLLIIIFLINVVGIINIKADTLTFYHSENKISYSGVSIFYKTFGTGTSAQEAYCLSGVDVDVPSNGISCTKNDSILTEEKRLLIGEIINQSCGSLGNNECYITKEIAIMSYLGKNIDSPEVPLSTDYITFKSPSTVSKNRSIYDEKDFSISFVDANSNQAINNLIFTLDGDYYKSQQIKISGSYIDGAVDKTITSITGATIEGNDSSFYIKIPRTSVKQNITVKLNAEAKQQPYHIAETYSCEAGKQDIAKLVINQRTTTNSIEGTIEPKGKLIINKLDENGNHLSGSTILIKGPGYTNEIVTNGSSIIIDNLEFLNYGIRETNAPDGYILNEEAQTVIINENNLTATINIVNKLIKIDILKIDENDKPLSGAIIKLMDKDGNTLEICKDENGDNSACRWTTTDKAYRIEGIPAGTYYLKEISTPKGYNVNPNKIKIVIDNYGKVKIDNKEVKDNLIKVSNELTTTKISKISAVNSEELPGATLEILNSKKEKISCLIINAKGEKETLKECKWVSQNKPTVVLGLDAGKYYLSETIAPEGYELNTNTVEFEVKADGTTTEVEMKNELSVKVPDTLSARSALLIAISMFDIALGIGIITYVKKNKVEE